jgi:hypothetical protein
MHSYVVQRQQDAPAPGALGRRVLEHLVGPPALCFAQLARRGWCHLYWCCAIYDVDDLLFHGRRDVLQAAGASAVVFAGKVLSCAQQ